MADAQVSETIFDYKTVSTFAKRYLQTYFMDIDPDEEAVASFLVREYQKIQGKPAMLEIGCGPTVHHSLPAAPHISSLDMADYLEENIQQIAAWQAKEKDVHDWSYFTRRILELENKDPSPEATEARETLLRTQITHLDTCNVLHTDPVGNGKAYDVVGFFYCAEEVTTDKEIWKQIIRNVTDLVNPGGRFYLACLEATDYYTIVSPEGTDQRLPCCNIQNEDFEQLLPSLDFDMSETVIESVQFPGQEHQGITGVILVSAKKKSF